MNSKVKNILVITQEAEVSKRISSSLSLQSDFKVETESNTLTALNGQAIELACKHDVVIFKTDANNKNDIKAIRELAKGHKKDTTFIALTDNNISLAEARELNKAGADEVLPYPISDAELVERITKLTQQKQASQQSSNSAVEHSGKIIAVAQACGGIGSTTVAVNLADQLLNAKGFMNKVAEHRVALVDFDFQFGTVGSFLDVKEQDSMLQLALDGSTPDQVFLKQAMVTLPSGLSVLTAPSKFAPIDALKNHQVASILDTLRAEFDFVVLDMPRALVTWISPILERADTLYLVTSTSVPAIRQSRRLIDFFSEDHLALPIRMLVNHESRPILAAQHHKEAAKVLERGFEHWLPHDPKAAQAAVDRGKPVSFANPRSKLARAFKKLAKDTLITFPVTEYDTETA